jgi:hypothetical protein
VVAHFVPYSESDNMIPVCTGRLCSLHFVKIVYSNRLIIALTADDLEHQGHTLPFLA